MISIFVEISDKPENTRIVNDIDQESLDENSTTTTKEVSQANAIFIDVSGAVINPDVYEVTPGARLKDVILKAGGLAKNADAKYVARNFNFAKLVGDQEKIYIPYTFDIASRIFVESPRILEYLQPLYNSSSETQQTNPITISINTSSIEELDTMPGIGPVTAQKIIDNRPYSSIDDLLIKKVLNQTTFQKIQNMITL